MQMKLEICWAGKILGGLFMKNLVQLALALVGLAISLVIIFNFIGFCLLLAVIWLVWKIVFAVFK